MNLYCHTSTSNDPSPGQQTRKGLLVVMHQTKQIVKDRLFLSLLENTWHIATITTITGGQSLIDQWLIRLLFNYYFTFVHLGLMQSCAKRRSYMLCFGKKGRTEEEQDLKVETKLCTHLEAAKSVQLESSIQPSTTYGREKYKIFDINLVTRIFFIPKQLYHVSNIMLIWNDNETLNHGCQAQQACSPIATLPMPSSSRYRRFDTPTPSLLKQKKQKSKSWTNI